MERITARQVHVTAISYVRLCIFHVAILVLLNTYAAVVPRNLEMRIRMPATSQKDKNPANPYFWK